MTIERFQSIVLRLANQMPVRYYLYRGPTGEENVVMVIALYRSQECTGQRDRLSLEMKDLGFVCLKRDGVERCDEWSVKRTDLE